MTAPGAFPWICSENYLKRNKNKLMRIVWPWERKRVEKELDSIELLLSNAFKPVKARPTFISDLRKRLVGSKNPLARVSLSTLELLLLISGAIASLFAMLFMLVRAIVGIFSRLGGEKASGTKGSKKKTKLPSETKQGAV